ncbi:MAG TPA: hypothetical protein VGH28_10775 [Polyangiaceae bacterium]
MMRRAAIVAFGCALVGCAALSGLDQLTTDDADATGDVADVAALDSPNETGSPESGPDAATCAYTLGTRHCFENTSSCPGSCCISSSSTTCVATSCSQGSVVLACTSPADCQQNVCCFEQFGDPVIGCPLLFPAAGATSTCTTADTCNAASVHARLCASDKDCLSGQTCVAAAFAINPADVFGVCH